jgi:Spy/CpxP family protein refolding chaperone
MKRALMLIALLAVAAPLVAQEMDLPPGKWWEEPRLIERLGLSAEQRATIRALVYDHARRMVDLKADVDRAGLDLAEVVKRDELDADAVRAAYAAFQRARAKLESERFEMLLAVRQELTTEQWRTMQEIKRRAQEMRGDRRPGGQRPPGERPPGMR